MRRRITPAPDAPVRAVSAKVLYIAYGASLLLTGVVQEIAWKYPMFTQAILAITFTHLGLLFVLTRRFTRPHFEWEKLALLMAIEIAVGFTGYFAGFRELATNGLDKPVFNAFRMFGLLGHEGAEVEDPAALATEQIVAEGVRAKAGEAVSRLADVAQQAGTQAKEAASVLASDANQKAKGFLNQQVASGADLAGHVADSVRSAADNLDRSAPQLADLVRGAADRVEEFSRDIRGQSVDELMRTASDFTRRQPALVFGLASLAGFVLLRVLKSNPPSNSRATHLGSERVGGSRQFHGV